MSSTNLAPLRRIDDITAASQPVCCWYVRCVGAVRGLTCHPRMVYSFVSLVSGIIIISEPWRVSLARALPRPLFEAL